MKNFEKWLNELDKNKQDFPLPCFKCPAKKECDEASGEFDCISFFIKWATEEEK